MKAPVKNIRWISVIIIVITVSVKSLYAQDNCVIYFVNQDNAANKVECMLKIVDDEDNEIYKKNSMNGKFNLAEIEEKLNGYCRLKFQESNNRYWPIDPNELKCPIKCNKRILIKKKQKFQNL